MIDLDEEEEADPEKQGWARVKWSPTSAQLPRERTRAHHAKNLEAMGYDTNEEVEIDREE